jgi:uncharacterized protein YkwD
MDSFAERGPRVRDGARWLSLGVLFSLAAASALTGALVACGGGGDAPPAPAPAPTPVPVPTPSPTPSTPIAAQLTVPTPVGYDADRLAAFNRLNEIRLSAGLGMVAQNTMMDLAAQAHAEWMLANDSFLHGEVAGTPGFTGENYARRDEFFGYVPVGGGEVMAQGPASAGVDSLVNAAYHRAILLAFEPDDVGIGWSGNKTSNVQTPLVIDVTMPGTDSVRGLGQSGQPSIRGTALWPIDGARNVPIRLGLETPNPVPTQDVLTLGTPVSITVDGSRTIHASQFTLTDVTTGAIVPIQLLTNKNDTNSLIPESFIAAIPLAPLSAATVYRADFSGSTVQFPSGAVEVVSRTWSFTTAAQ